MESSWIIDGNFSVRDIPALVLALSPELNLNIIAISITHGRSSLKDSANRVQNILRHYGKSIPIYLGAENPLVQNKINLSEEESDLNNDFPEFAGELKGDLIREEHASFIIAKLAKEHSGDMPILLSTIGSLNLLCIGALTNIILAYHIEHNLYEMFNRVVVSGGSIYQRGTLSKSGDFNFTCDAHAANLIIKIFKTKCAIIPSEINHKFTFDANDGTINEKSSSTNIWNRIQNILQKKNNSIGALLYIKNPDLVKDSITTKCQVETRSKECLGQLLILWPINTFFSHGFPEEFKKMETTNIIKELDVSEGKKLIKIGFSSINV